MSNKAIIWTISGADCSGGAGIAADIKTGHCLGVEVCHLITANTVQNSTQLLTVNPVDVDILAAQAEALYQDKRPMAVKIGLIANEHQLKWLVTLLSQLRAEFPHLTVVYDPVGQASVGGDLSSLSFVQLLPLFPLVDVLTPNLLEAQQLVSQSKTNATLINTDIDENVAILADNIAQLGSKHVIIKGGHNGSSSCTDYGYTASTHSAYQVTGERVATDFSHGSGCSFATAMACFFAHGYLFRDALTLAKAFMQQGLQHHQGKQRYYGAFEQTSWPTKARFFPRIDADINQKYHQLPAFKSLGITRDGSQSLGVYPVVDSVEWLARLLPLGIKIIQLRLKDKTEDELHQQIAQAVKLSEQYHCRLFINDYWQLAIQYQAYGVHIGQEDLQDADLEVIQQAGLRLGISTHGCYEFLLAQQLRPSYLAIGAIFPTKTKDMTGQIQGINNLQQTLKLATDIPVVAIGGITQQRAEKVWHTGVDAIAVVTAITEADNVEQATKALQAICS